MKKIAIMQPYFFPYIGYFQLIASVDKFIVYDNIQYTKKGWINRNQFLQNDNNVLFSLPLKKASDYLDIRERELSDSYDRDKLLRKFWSAYKKSPNFLKVFPLIEQCIQYKDSNLFDYIYNSIVNICQYLEIETDIKISSTINVDHSLKKHEKVLSLCKANDANIYINPIGGMKLYSNKDFKSQGIDLKFIKSKSFQYTQFDQKFVSGLSIVDVMFFNSKEKISREIIGNFELI